MNENLLLKLGYGFEKRNIHSYKDYCIYTMCDDSRLASLSLLLESNFQHDNAPVYVIPFNNNCEMVKELCKSYNAELIDIDQKWDNVGKALFHQEEYRANVEAWRYFRKFNVFNDDNREFIFLDSNVIICSTLKDIIESRKSNEIAFAARSKKNRNFKPWFKFLINRVHPRIGNGFNAGFFSANSNLLNNVNFEKFIEFNEIRKCLGVAPEQSVLSMLVGLYKIPFIDLKQNNQIFNPIIFAEKVSYSQMSFIEDRVYKDNKLVKCIKWSGIHYLNNSKLPNYRLAERYIDKVVERIDGNELLFHNIKNKFNEIAIDIGITKGDL